MLDFNEGCDRCGPSTRAHHEARKAPLKLYLCNHCHKQHRGALLDQLWVIESDVTAEPVMATAN